MKKRTLSALLATIGCGCVLLGGALQAAAAAPVKTFGNWRVSTLVPPSNFHLINGIAIGPDGYFYFASVASESLYRTRDFKTVESLVGPPLGKSDDLVLSPDGTIFYTTVGDGAVRRRDPDGKVRDIATGIPSVNPIVWSLDHKHLIVGQMQDGGSFWEVDPEGVKPARKILDNIGGANAFAIDSDGTIYAPLYFKQKLVKIDPHTGAVTTILNHIEHPVTVRLAPDRSVLAVESSTGHLKRLKDGEWETLGTLPTGVDNMIVRPDGKIFATTMGDGSVTEFDLNSRRMSTVYRANLGFPTDIDFANGKIYVADFFSLRSVDPVTGKVTDIARPAQSKLLIPSAISTGNGYAALASEFLGYVQIMDLSNNAIVQTLTGFDKPTEAIRTRDGKVYVLQPVSGTLVRVDGDAHTVVADGLKAPTGMSDAGDGTVIVAESGSGALLAINLATGAKAVVKAGLGKPRAVAIGKTGYAVLDEGGGKVWWVNKATRSAAMIARDLPVGFLAKPYPRTGGIALGDDRTIYVSADKNNAIYKITRH